MEIRLLKPTWTYWECGGTVTLCCGQNSWQVSHEIVSVQTRKTEVKTFSLSPPALSFSLHLGARAGKCLWDPGRTENQCGRSEVWEKRSHSRGDPMLNSTETEAKARQYWQTEKEWVRSCPSMVLEWRRRSRRAWCWVLQSWLCHSCLLSPEDEVDEVEHLQIMPKSPCCLL